jgi:hypothetical protein
LADAPHGMIEFVYKNNMRRTAEYSSGNHVGTDVWTERDDSTYLTDWHREGYGERTETNGITYKGYWKADWRHGIGDYDCKEYHYVGEYKYDKRHGQGTIFYSADKSTYTGQFVHDRCKFDGYGELITADGITENCQCP